MISSASAGDAQRFPTIADHRFPRSYAWSAVAAAGRALPSALRVEQVDKEKKLIIKIVDYQ
jgi:hypothetical protein